MLALIFLPVAWMRKINFILGLDVGARGVGIVGKNIVNSTMTRKQENVVMMQKTTITACVVVRSQVLKKKTIVRVDIVHIVESVGKQIFP